MRDERMMLTPRLRKIVTRTGIILSLLLVIAWSTSKWRDVSLTGPQRVAVASLGQGTIRLAYYEYRDRTGPLWFDSYKYDFPRTLMWWFSGERGGKPGRPSTSCYVIIPIWAPLLLVGGCTAGVWRKDRQIARRADVACVSCGYDIRGLAKGATCPECGTPNMGPVHDAIRGPLQSSLL